MGQEKFSWLDQIAPKPAAPAPAPIAPAPGPEKKGKFSFLDEFTPGVAAAAVPGAPLPPYPKKEPSYGIPYIIKETVKGAAADLTKIPKQPVQARFIAPPVTPATVAEFKPMATDVLEAGQTIVRGVPAFAAGLAAQGVTSLKVAWQKYLEKGPLGLTGMDILKSLGAPEAVEAGQEVMEQLGYEPKTAGGAELASAAMLPFELLDKGWEKVVNLATPDPALRQSFMFLGRAATFYLLPKATEYLKGVIKRGAKPNLVELTKIVNQEKGSLPEDMQSGVEALNARLEELMATSERGPEEIQTFAEMPHELVPAGEVKPTPPKGTPGAPAAAAAAAPAPPKPAPAPAAPKPVLTNEAAPPDFLRVERQALEGVAARIKGERPKYPTKDEVPIIAEIEKAITAGIPGFKKHGGELGRQSYTVDRPYGQLFIDAEGEIRTYLNKGTSIDQAIGAPAAAPAAAGKGYVRTDQALRDAVTRVVQGEGSSEDIKALASAAKRIDRLKTLTEGYRGRLETDLLTGVGSDRALAKVKDHAERRQYWMDLKGVKEGNNDPNRGYRWTDENIFKPTGDVLKSSGADAYRRGGGSDEFIILSKPGESPEQFQGRITDIERQLGKKKVEFRGVLAENMAEAERLMAQKKKGEPVVPAPSAPGREAEPTGEVEFEAVAQKPKLAMRDRRNGKTYEGQAGETTHGDMIARLQGQGVPVDDMVPGWTTPEGKWTQTVAEATPKARPIPAAKAPAAAGRTTPAQEKGLKFPKPFKNHGFMTFNNINGKAWEQARELVKDGWVIEYDHSMGKDGIARIVDKLDPGDGNYYRAEGTPLRKLYEKATAGLKERAARFPEKVQARPLVSLIKSRGGISWEKIKEAGLAGEFEAVLEGPNKDVITKRKGKGISPYEAAELAQQHKRLDTEEIQPLIDELTGRGRGKPTAEEVEAGLAGEQRAAEREIAVVQSDFDALKSGKKKWEDLHDPQQEDLVAMFGEEGLKGLAPKEEVRRIMDRLEEEFEPARPSREEEPEWFAEVEKAEGELKAEADKVAGDLKSGRKKWEDLTAHEKDDVIDVYGAEVQDKYRRQVREADDISDIEEALVRGRKLTKAQEERARKAGILEEVPEKGEPAEPEIPKTPEEVLTKKTEAPTGTMQLVNLAVRTPADTVFAFNNVPAKDLPKIREYAKKLGVEDKLIVGDEHAGTWGEAYSPAEHLAHVREILRDVKKQPKGVWQSWERHVKIDTSGLEPDKGPPVGLSVQALSGFGPQIALPGAPAKPHMMSDFGRFYQSTLDRLHAIRKLGDFLKKDKIELLKENDPYIGARLYAGVQGKAELWLLQKRFKMVKGNRVYTGESLSTILKPVAKDIENFSRYLVYRRVPELEARGIETGIDPAAARAFVHQHQGAFEGQAKKFTDYHNELLDLLVDAGRISKEKADIIKGMNPNYAAFQRGMDDIVKYGYVPTSAKFLAKIPNPIKQIRGSDLPVIDPIESAVTATYIIHNVAERARINRQVIALRDISLEIAKLIKPTKPAMELVATLEDGTKVFRPKKNQPEGIIESWKDGERHYYEVPLDLYQAMSGLDSHSMSLLVKAMAIPARILRTGATTTPEFAFRNPLKDQWSGFVNAKYGYFPGIDFVRGLFHMVGKSDAYNAWKAAGGDWAMVTALDRATNRKTLQRVLGRRDYLLFLKNPIKLLERASMYTEIPSRVGAFARAKGKGVTDIEAAFEAREATVDFARRGAKTKEISAIYTFFNARLQGMDRTARALKERPFSTTAKIFAVATIPSVINYFINRDDPAYQEIPAWQRHLFWMPFKISGTFVRIPKGDVGVLFGTPVEMILETLDRDPQHRPAIDKFAVDLFKETLPISDWGGLFPVALRPLFENYVNFNFFKKRTIVPMGMERLEPEFQSFPYTTESAKALGQVLHYPPAKIENFIRGYGGGLGTHALRILDTVLTKTGQIPEKPEKPKEPADVPGIGAFFVRHPEGFGSESSQKFYDVMKKIDQVKQTHSMLYQEKRKTELDAYVAKHPVEMKAIEGGYYSAFVKVRNELSEIRAAQDRIYEDPKLDVNRKRLGLELLDRKIMIAIVPLLNRYAALGEKYGKIKQ